MVTVLAQVAIVDSENIWVLKEDAAPLIEDIARGEETAAIGCLLQEEGQLQCEHALNRVRLLGLQQ